MTLGAGGLSSILYVSSLLSSLLFSLFSPLFSSLLSSLLFSLFSPLLSSLLFSSLLTSPLLSSHLISSSRLLVFYPLRLSRLLPSSFCLLTPAPSPPLCLLSLLLWLASAVPTCSLSSALFLFCPLSSLPALSPCQSKGPLAIGICSAVPHSCSRDHPQGLQL